ncbi:MAG: CHAT domain-containing protein, partial [Gammaproteobacteria bacterium]
MAARGRIGSWILPVVLAYVPGGLLAAPPGIPSCIPATDAASVVLDRTVALRGDDEYRLDLPDRAGIDTVVYALESGVDIQLDVHEMNGALVATAESPVARSGIQRIYLPAARKGAGYVLVRGREHPGVTGSVRVMLARVAPGDGASSCNTIERNVAAADETYARSRTVASAPIAGLRGDSRSALEFAAAQYEKAAFALDGTSRILELGNLQLALAALYYYDLPDWARSAQWAEAAAATFERGGALYLRARAQAILAAAWLEVATKSSAASQSSGTPPDTRATLDRARALLAQLEEFHAGRSERYDRALQTNNIGLAYFYEARFEPAIAYFTRARAEFDQLGETQRVAIALQNIALCEWGLGRLSAALTRFDRAVSLMSPQPYPDLYIATLYSSALAHYAAGRFDDALRLQGQALDLATRLQLDRARARGYYGMGVTYYAIGDRELAARFLRRALEMLTPDVDGRGRVAALRALAVIELETGQSAQAAAHDSEALRLAASPSARSRILLRLASDYAAQADAKAALVLLDSLASFAPNGDALVQALALAQRAKVRRASGALDAARRDVQLALKTLRQFEAVTDEFEAQVELARIEADAGNEEAALGALSEALGLTGEITSQTANPEYRASIAQSVRPALDLKIELLWTRYQRLASSRDTAGARVTILESLRTADDSRALAFEQLRAQRLENNDDPRVPELQRTIATLYRDIADRRFQLSTREDRAGPNDPAAKALREDISRLRARLGVANADLAARAAPTSPQSLAPRDDWMARAIASPAGRALIEYWIGTAHSYAWTIVRGQISWVRLEPSAQIERVARTFHEAMRSYATTPVRSRLESGAELHRLIFAPLRMQLTGVRELTIVPDGPLHYVPFGALRDGAAASDKAYVAQNFSVELAPALRLTLRDPVPPPPAAWAESRMLMVADPVYRADDPRLQPVGRSAPSDRLSGILRTRGGADAKDLERLISSARESEQIRALPGLRHVDLLEGLDATRARVLALNLGGYRFIHIASHGIIDSEIPQLSALILGAWDRNGPVADQYVRAGDLLGRTFDAQVVVLSACDTALGRQFAGEGLVGLQYAALARGARSVVASLWQV